MTTNALRPWAPHLALKRYVQGMERRGEVVPGAAEAIVSRHLGSERRPFGELLKGLEEYLHGERDPRETGYPWRGLGRQFVNPGHEPGPEAPVKTIVDRLVAGQIVRRESGDRLYRDLAVPCAGVSVGNAGRLVVDHLARDDQRSHVLDGSMFGMAAPRPDQAETAPAPQAKQPQAAEVETATPDRWFVANF